MSLPNLIPFAWDRLEALAALMRDLQGAAGAPVSVDPRDVAETLRAPGVDSESDVLLALDGERMVGYTHLRWELPIGCVALEGGVLPEARGRGIGRRLLAWARERGRQAGAAAARAACPEDNVALAAFLQRQGFAPVRRHLTMRCAGGVFPALELPPGVRLRTYDDGDADALAETQNAAFGGQWGFSPNTPAQIAHTVGRRRTTPGGVALLEDDAGIAAYCITQRPAVPDTTGAILMLGVHPRRQGGGLGRAALLAGMRLLRDAGAAPVELTVDAENAAARWLYAAHGFAAVAAHQWHEAALSGG